MTELQVSAEMPDLLCFVRRKHPVVTRYDLRAGEAALLDSFVEPVSLVVADSGTVVIAGTVLPLVQQGIVLFDGHKALKFDASANRIAIDEHAQTIA